MTVLQLLVVDISAFSGCSTRSTASEILKRNHWSNTSLFEKFVRREVLVEYIFYLITQKRFERKSSKQ